MGTIRFVLRTDKLGKNGAAPIQGVYSLNGKRKYFKTREKVRPVNWNANLQRVVYLVRKEAKQLLPGVNYNFLPSLQEVETHNSNLAALRREIKDIESRNHLNDVASNPTEVVKSIKSTTVRTKIDAPKNELIDFIDTYIADHKATREPGSLSVYKALKKHLIAFRQKTKKKITFDGMDYSFFQSFQNFLISRTHIDKSGVEQKTLNNTTIAKQLSTVKTFLNYAKRQDIKVSDKYRDFKIKKDNLEVIALTNDEFETLFYLDLSNDNKLAKVRDIFCFACTTGLRYSDMDLLKNEHIKKDEIRLIVKKPKEPLSIPLNPFSNVILARYSNQARPLPMISNQKLNDYLKELCKLAGINDKVEIVRFRGAAREVNTYKKYELIGVHTGRKTFATLSLEKGMSAEETMAITGHKDYKSFQRYVTVTEQRKKTVMLRAWGGQLSEVKLRAV
ncbi:MAG TPA: site-specific integrase [Ferruginibacter sp.]|nr:site-specific integrase [Ferruginibacter sp.]